jgi:phosphotriesterase-related protein
MPQIETVKGPIDVDALGPTLMHEHVFVLSTDYAQNYGPGQWWDENERVEHAIARLRSLHAKGVTSIADPTVVGLGRYIPRMKRIAEQVPVNIIAATGVYTYGDLPFPYANRGPGSMFGGDEPMVADFVRDISEGIADTGVKAGFLKCAVEHADVSPGVERVLRAVGKAHVATGAPITVHTSSPEYTGRYVVRVLTEEGADLTKVVIGHAGDSNDLDYLMELADTGALLGMDRFGIDLFNPTPERINTIVALATRGYADRMVLAHDASCWIDWFGPDVLAMQAALTPNWHYEHISDDVLPALAEAGVTAEQIDEMMVGNPRRYFSS